MLWVTDPGYPARGRRYGDEDALLVSRLSDRFRITTAHPADAPAALGGVDGVVVRNSGPVAGHRAAHGELRARVGEGRIPVHNPLTGRGDQAGKAHLVEMTRAGMPVIPTVDDAADLARLPATERYVVKPVDGADSHGLRVVTAEEMPADLSGLVAQPLVGFAHELSLYVIDGDVRYALAAPDPERRWEMVPFAPSADDLAFARLFAEWNDLPRGIQRVDACRMPGGGLLLVELEDLNPYLSLDALSASDRDAVVAAIGDSIAAVLAGT